MKEFIIKVKNDAIFKIVQEKLFEEGYEWQIRGKHLKDNLITEDYPIQIRTDKEGYIGGYASEKFGGYSEKNFPEFSLVPRIDFEELFTMTFEKELLLELGNCQVKVSKEGFTCEGHTFPLDTLDKIKQEFEHKFEQICVYAPDPKLHELVQKKFFELGYEWFGPRKEILSCIGDYYYIYVLSEKNSQARGKSNTIAQTSFLGCAEAEGAKKISLEDFFSKCRKETLVTDSNNTNLAAVFDGNSVKIGCKTFTKSDIEKLEELSKQVKQ